MINVSDHLRSAFNGQILDPSLGAEVEDSSNMMFSRTSSDESNITERRSRMLLKALPQRVKAPGPKLTYPEKLKECLTPSKHLQFQLPAPTPVQKRRNHRMRRMLQGALRIHLNLHPELQLKSKLQLN